MKIRHIFQLLLVALTLTSLSGARADDPPPTPTSLAGAKVISAAEAKALLDAKGAHFFDTRSVLNFGKGHIPGAVTASYKEKSDKNASFDASKDEFALAALPADKNAKIVFYSDGPTGWKSYKATVLAVKAGYKNVHYLRGGFQDWTANAWPVER